MAQNVFVNRTLNLKRIRYLGLDMDHTLIRYNSEEFEKLSYNAIKEKLIKNHQYPKEILSLAFDFNLAIRGLVIDRRLGNLIKLNRHSAIRNTFHGTTPLDFKTQSKVYHSTYIDLSDSNYMAIDTTFSISLAIVYAQLVELKEKNTQLNFPDFSTIAGDVLMALDEAHRDGSLKDVVKQDLARFIIKDPELVAGLEKFKQHGKKIFIVTNSDFHYTKLLLDYAINPFLKNHKDWTELFEFTVVSGQKPRFFFDDLKFLKINTADGTMTNLNEKITPGVYQGGSAKTFTRDLNLQGDEILYIGDHIYGDILRLKKDCGWRTAMVIEEIEKEIDSNLKTQHLTEEIESLMHKKEPLEETLTRLMTEKIQTRVKPDENQVESIQKSITDIDSQISALIKKQQTFYNEHWGLLMRAGNEESYFAYQVERYACVYMAKLADLLALSPRTYFRAPRRPLAHELI